MRQYICPAAASLAPSLGINKDRCLSVFPQHYVHVTKVGSKRVNRHLATSLGLQSECACVCTPTKFLTCLEHDPLKIQPVSKVFWSCLHCASGVGTWSMAFSVLGGSQFPSSLTLLIQRNLVSPEMVDKWDLYFYMSWPGREFSMEYNERVCPSWGWKAV